MNVTLSEEQRNAAREAAWLRYEDGKNKQDRPGWLWGKCPATEYYGNVGELGAAKYMGIPDTDIVLYSDNPKDYCKPDAGIWEFKAGASWNVSDVRKGARYILWVTPVELPTAFDCGIDTCGKRNHHSLSGDVLIRGWNHVDDEARRMGNRYFPVDMNSLTTIPWKVAA